VAWRNLELMAACTHEGLLYGGPDYFVHGDRPCIHHAFTHAKALATVLDRGAALLDSSARVALPREEAYGLKSFPEIGTHLAAVGDWRATATENDYEYVEQVQAGGGQGGGHATGGTLTMLYHRVLGPILTASMTEYKLIEISNQQVVRSGPTMPLTPRIELVTGPGSGGTYTSLSDLEAVVAASEAAGEVRLEARGRLLTATHKPVAGGEVRYSLKYAVSASGVEIVARTDGAETVAPMRFILPVISRSDETVVLADAKTVVFAKAKAPLSVRTDSSRGFEALPKERTFNLVPGFECLALEVAMDLGKDVTIRIEAAAKT
jgi:hypothetical protein